MSICPAFMTPVMDFFDDIWKSFKSRMGKKFGDIDFTVEFMPIMTVAWWFSQLSTAVATATWIMLGSSLGSSLGAWGWGLGYAMTMCMFKDAKLCFVKYYCDFINAKNSCNLGHILYMVIFQMLGAIVGSYFYGQLSDVFSYSAIVPTHNWADAMFWKGTFSDFWSSNFWFCNEFMAILVFSLIYRQQSGKGNSMPEFLWAVVLFSLAYMIGGDGFFFFPGRAFVGEWSMVYDNKCSAWATIFIQCWGVTAADMVFDFVWPVFFD